MGRGKGKDGRGKDRVGDGWCEIFGGKGLRWEVGWEVTRRM
jgi:hypothetical protein